MMHGTTNIKFIDAQQAKLAYQYKNTKKTPDDGWDCRPKHVKPLRRIKRNCCILLDLFHYYKAWCSEPQILNIFWNATLCSVHLTTKYNVRFHITAIFSHYLKKLMLHTHTHTQTFLWIMHDILFISQLLQTLMKKFWGYEDTPQ